MHDFFRCDTLKTLHSTILLSYCPALTSINKDDYKELTSLFGEINTLTFATIGHPDWWSISCKKKIKIKKHQSSIYLKSFVNMFGAIFVGLLCWQLHLFEFEKLTPKNLNKTKKQDNTGISFICYFCSV